jgi:CubicO group peptidase (beta-lactamase class C family)
MVPARPEGAAHRPGTHWHHNNWDFNVLGSIYERATHRSVHVAFDRLIAQPLEMQDWDVFQHAGYDYRSDPLGGNLTYANYTFALSARDLARFGQLYLQGGDWGGTRLIPDGWVQQSTRPIVATNQPPGVMGHYGYCWWVAGPQAPANSGIPADTFTAWGLSGNFLSIIPSRQMSWSC